MSSNLLLRATYKLKAPPIHMPTSFPHESLLRSGAALVAPHILFCPRASAMLLAKAWFGESDTMPGNNEDLGTCISNALRDDCTSKVWPRPRLTPKSSPGTPKIFRIDTPVLADAGASAVDVDGGVGEEPKAEATPDAKKLGNAFKLTVVLFSLVPKRPVKSERSVV